MYGLYSNKLQRRKLIYLKKENMYREEIKSLFNNKDWIRKYGKTRYFRIWGSALLLHPTSMPASRTHWLAVPAQFDTPRSGPSEIKRGQPICHLEGMNFELFSQQLWKFRSGWSSYSYSLVCSFSLFESPAWLWSCCSEPHLDHLLCAAEAGPLHSTCFLHQLAPAESHQQEMLKGDWKTGGGKGTWFFLVIHCHHQVTPGMALCPLSGSLLQSPAFLSSALPEPASPPPSEVLVPAGQCPLLQCLSTSWVWPFFQPHCFKNSNHFPFVFLAPGGSYLFFVFPFRLSVLQHHPYGSFFLIFSIIVTEVLLRFPGWTLSDRCTMSNIAGWWLTWTCVMWATPSPSGF